jgi:hypothetical protein
MTHAPNRNWIDLGDRFHPQVVDRFIEHCYMGDYRFEKVGREILRYAKNFPDGKNTHSFPYKGQHLDLHLDMYAIAETFDASFLKWTVHQKLTEALLVNFVLSADEMATFVNKVFHAGDGKIVEDSERQVANIITTSVILHEQEIWSQYETYLFCGRVSWSEMFAEGYKKAKAENIDLWRARVNKTPGHDY